MTFTLAYADQTDLSGSQWQVILLSGVVVAVVAVLVAMIIGTARSRWHKYVDAITGLAVLWGMGAVLSGINTINVQFKWRKEWLLRIESGYLDPRDKSGMPHWPWWQWALLGVGFVALMLFARAQRNAPPDLSGSRGSGNGTPV